MALNRASWHFLTQKKPKESHQDSLSLFLLGVRTNPKSFEDFIHRSRNETFPEFFFLEDPKSFEEALGEDPNIKAMRRLRSFGTLKHCESEKPLGSLGGNLAVLQSFAGSIARRDPSNGRLGGLDKQLWDKP